MQEDYLNNIHDKRYRIALTEFRISAHNLAIERGRYENILREERKCIYCNLNVKETEFHFLLVCTFYSDLRRKYFSPYYCHWPNLTKFDKLISSTAKRMQRNLAKFIYFAEKLRT